MGDRTYLSGDSMGKRLKMDRSKRLFGKRFFLKPSTQGLKPIQPLYRIRTINEQRSSAHMQKKWDLLYRLQLCSRLKEG